MTMEPNGPPGKHLKGSKAAGAPSPPRWVPTRTRALLAAALGAIGLVGASLLLKPLAPVPAVQKTVSAVARGPAPSVLQAGPGTNAPGVLAGAGAAAASSAAGAPGAAAAKVMGAQTAEPLGAGQEPEPLDAADAAGAYLRGDYAGALQLYTKLAAQEPSEPAYSAMVRIITRKAAQGGH